MDQTKRWITEYLERKAFEDIIRQIFTQYKDNMMCSQDILDNIIVAVTSEIRKQLKGITRDYINK